MNFDQTAVGFTSPSKVNPTNAPSKVNPTNAPISKLGDKSEITGTFTVTLDGAFLRT